MNIKKIYNELIKVLPKEDILLDEPMKKHTSFKIGGPADIFVKVKNIEQLEVILKLIINNNIKYRIIGNGSNILVKDEGYRGIIIKNEIEGIKEVIIDEENVTINISSGTKLVVIAQYCLKNELDGFEFASGIPGTIGGAVKMNAGAHGSEIKDIIQNVTYIDKDGKIKIIQNNECEFEYRNSIFGKKNYIILNVNILLKKGNKSEIQKKLEEYKNYRIEKQPIELPNAGSTFKRGIDFITAKLIDDAGLKGYMIGGAQISEKHAGFIVNKNNATAEDVMNLAEYAKKVVYEKFGKEIELEIEVI